MEKVKTFWEKDGYVLRSACREDAENYYQQNFNPLEPEVSRLTGCKPSFTHDEVVNFFLSCIDDEGRYDFLSVCTAWNWMYSLLIQGLKRHI
ncbi:hypothetical protein [Sporofaciens musculi]|uniref:hypothetical protein n=1 Tax=Sporofaciens musculi TaxID=2681861 RepID=UPI001FCC6BC6|nr:hypothetical protein [Sporofaciens musculi]